MADDANADGGEEIEVGKSGGRMGTVLLAVVPAIIASVLTAGGVNFYMNQADPGANDGASQGSGDGSTDKDVDIPTTMVDLGSFTVNLRDSSGRVLSMKIQIEIDKDEEKEKDATNKLPELRDYILLLASDYSYTDLEGIDGKMRLKDEIHIRVNSVLEPDEAKRVFFTEFVVQ